METPVTPSETPVQPRAAVGVSPRLVVWLILGLAFAVSANSILNGFAYDDVGIIQANPLVYSLSNLREILTTPYWGGWGTTNTNYRPVLVLSFALNHAWTGMNPWSYHLVNVLLHTMVVGLLFHLLRRYGIGFRTAAATAALFSVHPVHTEAVANVVGRAELLAAVFFGLAWWSWDVFRRGRMTGLWNDATPAAGPPLGRESRLFFFLATLAAFLLAILTKEHTVTLPAILITIEFFHWRNWTDRGIPANDECRDFPSFRFLAPYAGFGVVLALFIIFRRIVTGLVLGGSGNLSIVESLSRPGQFATMTAAVLDWVRLLVLGYPLKPLYDQHNFQLAEAMTFRSWLGLAWLVSFAWFGWVNRRRKVVLTFCVVLFFITASIYSNLFFSFGSLIAERALYLTSISACLLGGYLFNAGRESTRNWQKALALGLFVGFLSWYAAVSIMRNRDWHDNRTLFTSFLATDRGHPMAALGLATILQEEGNHDGAARLYATVLANDPGNLQARTGLGIRAFAVGNQPECDRIFTEMFAEEPPDLKPVAVQWGICHKVYGELLAKTGQIEQARVQLERANVLFPNFPDIQKSLADVYLLEGAPARAIPLYRQVLERNPTLIAERNNLGVSLMRIGKNEEAEAEFREVLRRQPDNRSAGANLDVLERKKNTK